ncbi:MAG: hypothetical protein LBB34_02040 [Holosporales bacterium]|jgi:hypothetical protein|nr:hypothetical protein [Holosporales bacterium]
MTILQSDIFGTKHQVTNEREKKKQEPPAAQKKVFHEITIRDGLDTRKVTNDAMLIHRILQKKLIYSGLTTEKQRSAFIRILKNELSIKQGAVEPMTATRDSLLSIFTR